MVKRNILYTIILLSLMFGSYSCMSNLPEGSLDQQVSKGEKISIQISMPQGKDGKVQSRVAFNDADLGLTWEDGDQLALLGYNSANSIVGKQILTLTSRTENKATFEGYTVAGATQYDVFYPANAIGNNGEININYDHQVQNGDNNAAHLKSRMLLKQTEGKLTTEDILNAQKDIPMQMQNAIIKFDLKNIFINKPVALKWEIEEQGGTKTEKSLGIQQINGEISNTFIGYLSIPTFNTKAKSITISLLGQKDDNIPYTPMNYHIDLNKDLTYTSNNRYTANIEKGWIYKIYYQSNLNINESFKNNPSLNGMIEKEGYDPNTKWGYIDLKLDDNVALSNLRIPSIKKGIEYLDIYGICGITKQAFTGCNNLQRIVLHTGVKTIDKDAFEGCKKLTSVTLNEGLEVIESNVFHNCESLKEITIPKSVTKIGFSAFAQCVQLESIVLPQGITVIEKNTFEGCTALKQVTLNEGLSTIESNAFNGCGAMTSINLPNSLTTIESSAFINSGLTSITIPDKVTIIGSNTFKGCKKLTGITIQSTNPPEIVGKGNNKNLLGFENSKTINIYVPSGSIDTYKATSGWSSYKDRIFPIQ